MRRELVKVMLEEVTQHVSSDITGDAVPFRPYAEKALSKWQARLLPLMESMVAGLTLFFFLVTCGQLIYLHQRIGQAPRMNVSDLLPEQPAKSTIEETMQVAQLRATIALEANALDRRYHEASVVLMSQIWIRYLGFVTGMILALVGAVFILGKVQERFSEVAASANGLSGTLKSASPGLMLAVFGTILMLANIVVRQERSVIDAPVYTREWSSTVKASTSPQLPPLKRAE